jgi:selenocysteine lyase/cysteine desulfurase
VLTTIDSERVYEAPADEAYFADLRAREFGRLDRTGCAYLDYTGSGLYADSQVQMHATRLLGTIYGNPHSQHAASQASTTLLEQARHAVLQWLNADPTQYDVCFTANASGAIRLVGESYPFGRGMTIALSADNHSSVNGLRQFARRAGAVVRYVPLDDQLRLRDGPRVAGRRGRRGLFALPAQSNFSGVQHSLDLVRHAQDQGFDVLLDAASFVPTNALSLREIAPQFVALSFYKVFGYPTGAGALIARRDAMQRLRRPWFAGGTVEFVTVGRPTHQLKVGSEGFEDGTPNFLALGAVCDGLEFVRSIGVDRLHRRVEGLTRRLLDLLAAERHSNGAPVVRVYGPGAAPDRGGTIAFNVLDREGAIIPYEAIEEAASARGVAVRGGCFCNPGAAERAFTLPRSRFYRCLHMNSRPSLHRRRLSRCMGGFAVGALRASLGIASNEHDVARLITVLRSCIRDAGQPPTSSATTTKATVPTAVLHRAIALGQAKGRFESPEDEANA